jgi:hypothetical protein
MLRVDQLTGIERVRLPERYLVDHVHGGLAISCLRAAAREEALRLEPYRSRGTSFRRALAHRGEGVPYMLEFAGFADDYAELTLDGVIRGRRPAVVEGTLMLEGSYFVVSPFERNTAEAAFIAARNGWREGIHYRSEQQAVDGRPARSGLRKPQLGALHAIAAHRTLGR